jgi:hypothetical protein
MFIPDFVYFFHPGSRIRVPDPDPGIKKTSDPGPGSATLRITLEFQGNIGAQKTHGLNYFNKTLAITFVMLNSVFKGHFAIP